MSIYAIIGLDGSGKTTQATMLVDRLQKKGYDAIYVRPTYFLLSHILKLKLDNIPFISPRKDRAVKRECSGKKLSKVRTLLMAPLGYLYVLVTRFCMGIVSRNKIIVCDRYFYQFLYDLFGKSSNKVVRFLPKPDATFLLNTSLDVLYPRMQGSFDRTVCENYYIAVFNLLIRVNFCSV